MPYGMLLKKIIKEKNGYTYTYVAKECRKIGVKLDKSNLINIVNGKKKPPKEEISKAIAKVCDVDERLLILEAYLDTAPKEIMLLLNNLRYSSFLYAKKGMEDINMSDIVNTKNIPNNIVELIKNEFLRQPISEYILDYLNDIEKIEIIDTGLKLSSNNYGKENDFILSTKEPISFEIGDKGMEPKILEGARVTIKFKTKHNDGDIVLVVEDNKMIARMIFYKENEIILVPLNKEYKNLVYPKNDLTHILGKIEKIILEI